VSSTSSARPCPHLARRFRVRASGVILWRCITCHVDGVARDWREFDAQAGSTERQPVLGPVPQRTRTGGTVLQ
jgi:hypothetical protein